MAETKINKNILELSCSEARDFLLKGESYCNFDLPKYFIFDGLLKNLSNKLNGKELTSFYKQIPRRNDRGKILMDTMGNMEKCSDSPRNYDDVNYRLYNNKDGKYAWRPLELIHPALYISYSLAICYAAKRP